MRTKILFFILLKYFYGEICFLVCPFWKVSEMNQAFCLSKVVKIDTLEKFKEILLDIAIMKRTFVQINCSSKKHE